MKRSYFIITLFFLLFGFKFGTIKLGKEVGERVEEKYIKEMKYWGEEEGENDPRLVWLSEKMEGDIYWPSIAISSDTIYIGTSGWDNWPEDAEYTNGVYAIDRLTGKIMWSYKLLDDELIKGAIVVSDDGSIYFIVVEMGGYDSDKGKTYLYALNSDGSLKWKKEISPTQPHFWGTTSPALDSEGNIYVNVCVSTTTPPTYAIISFDSNENERWRYEFEGIEGVIWPSPVVYNDTIYCMTCKGLFALTRSTGGFLWNNSSYSGQDTTPPVVGNDGTIYAGAGNFFVAYTSTGGVKWVFNAKAKLISQAVIGGDGTIYLGTTAKNFDSDVSDKKGGFLWAIDPSTGGAKWFFDIDPWMYDEYEKTWKISDIYAPPVIGKNGTIYFTTEYRYIFAVNPDGTLKDIYDLNNFAAGWNGGTVTYSALVIDEDGILYKADSNYDSTFGKDVGVIIAIQTKSMGLANSSWPKGYKDYSNSNRY